MVETEIPAGFKIENGVCYGSRVPGLFEIKIHRPKARNATDNACNMKMKDLWLAVSEDPNIKLVVIHGGKFFCAGNDLAALGGSILGDDKSALKNAAENVTGELAVMLMAM